MPYFGGGATMLQEGALCISQGTNDPHAGVYFLNEVDAESLAIGYFMY